MDIYFYGLFFFFFKSMALSLDVWFGWASIFLSSFSLLLPHVNNYPIGYRLAGYLLSSIISIS